MGRRIAITASVLSIAASTFAYRAWAGQKTTTLVTVYNGATYGYASGSLGSARNSADTTQYIGCSTWNNGSVNYATCSAYNAASGGFGYCLTTDPNLVTIVRTMKGDDFLYFRWNIVSGSNTCDTIEHDSYSSYAPKNP